MPFPIMLAISHLWNTEFSGFYDGETPCGLIYLAHNRKIVFIMFFAIEKSLRSRGYGSAILQEIRKKYPGKKIIVSIEPCDEEAGDLGLRKRRKAFYMHNKYKETGYRIKLGGMAQELLIWNGEFVKKELRSFLALYSNGMLWPKIWKEIEMGTTE